MASDFLKNLKSGRDKHSGRMSYDRHKYHHESQQQHFGNEKRSGPDRRRMKMNPYQEAIVSALKALVPAVASYMEKASEFQERMIALEEKRVAAETAKAEAISRLGESIKSGIGVAGGPTQPPEKRRQRARKPLDQNRKRILQVISKMRSEGETFDKIAMQLEKENLRTFSGRGQWHAQTVHRLYQDHLTEQ
jgi:DNA repair exonuclease SbcCD ATPase subunit